MHDSLRDLKANFGRINLSPLEARGFDYKREYLNALKWFLSQCYRLNCESHRTVLTISQRWFKPLLAPGHYLSQCWLRSMSRFGAIMSQWVNAFYWSIICYIEKSALKTLVTVMDILNGFRLATLNSLLSTWILLHDFRLFWALKKQNLNAQVICGIYFR